MRFPIFPPTTATLMILVLFLSLQSGCSKAPEVSQTGFSMTSDDKGADSRGAASSDSARHQDSGKRKSGSRDVSRPSRSGKKGQFDSPEEVFQAMLDANANGDCRTFVTTVTPDSVEILARGSVIRCGQALDHLKNPGKLSRDPNRTRKMAVSRALRKVAESHGIADKLDGINLYDRETSRNVIQTTSLLRDKESFHVDETDATLRASGERHFLNKPYLTAELLEVVIEGDFASCTVRLGESRTTGDWTFRKIDGSWLVEMPGVQRQLSRQGGMQLGYGDDSAQWMRKKTREPS